MFEIRLDDDLITYDSELRDALITTIDYLLGREDNNLRMLYNKYAAYTSEDLIEEIFSLTDKRLAIYVNTALGANLIIAQHIMED